MASTSSSGKGFVGAIVSMRWGRMLDFPENRSHSSVLAKLPDVSQMMDFARIFRGALVVNHPVNGFSIIFVALTVLNAFRFRRTKDRWYLALCLLFGSMLVRERLPEVVFNLLLVGLIAWTVWLGAFKFIPSLRLRRLLANPSLKPLTDEERKWRAALEDWERDQIESYESVAGARLSRPRVEEYLESVRKARVERAAYLAEVAAEEEKEREAEAERKELEVTTVSSPLMARDSTGREIQWLLLQGVDDPDDEESGMVRCSVWPREPGADDAGQSSFLNLPAVIDFPAGASCANPLFWSSQSPEFKTMFKSRCLIADVGIMDDGRDRFEFQIEDRVFVIMSKYLSWQTALALDSDQQRVWVRISGMSSELWGETDDGQPKFIDFERIPAFVYPVPVDRLMPSTNPDAHFASIEERYE